MTPYLRFYRGCRRDARHFGGVPLWLLFRCLPVLLLTGMALLMLAASTARADTGETPGGWSPNTLESGHLLLRDADGEGFGDYAPAVVQSSRVHFDINGLIATVRLSQTFRNDSTGWVEGVYAFPLPDDSAVRYMEMRIGERRIVGKVREREAARQVYEAARKAGRKTSLVEQQRPNLFTNRVANIAPGEEVAVELEYVQAVQFDAGTFSLRFPMTITPRYMPGQPVSPDATGGRLQLDPYLGWAVATDEVPDAAAISPLLNPRPGSDAAPIHPLELTASLDMGMPLASVSSLYHEVALSRRAGVYSIELVDGVSEMDRDFVLQWQPVTGSAPRAALFTERFGAETFGLLMVVPPAVNPGGQPVPREVVFVVDTSGSMSGVSIRQARASLDRALARLTPGDSFNVIAFDSSYRKLFRSALPATPHHVQLAREFVRLLDASGGTEMMPALLAALAQGGESELHPDHRKLRQVVFITDGAVGNEEALFEAIAQSLGETRLFTVGIGSAPNSWFMRKAAEVGRGTHTHIGDISEVGARIDHLFEQLARPAVLDIAVDWPLAVEAWPARVPDLYHGQPLSVAVNFGAAEPAGEVMIEGQLAGRAWRSRLSLSPPAEPGHDGVASVWARRKIEGLLDTRRIGRDEEDVRGEVLPLALAHQLLSPYTSFVAVEEIVSRPEGEGLDSKAVPNTRPRGQGDQPFAYPRTATTGPARAWFALLALFLALVIRLVRQDELDHVAPAAS